VAALGLGFVATQLDWATVSASCAATDVTRGFGESAQADPWNWLYVLGIVAGLGSTLVVPRLALALQVIGAIAAGASLVVLTMLVTEPFEALRPAAAGGPVGRLCGFDLAIGFWSGTIAVALLVVAAILRSARGRAARA
jgi:hypothetical protein